MPDAYLNNERELLLRIAEGDEQAFAALFAKYRDRIYTLALRFSPGNTVAEEMVQDVFLKIWLKRSSLPEVENFKAYMYAILRHHAYRTIKNLDRYQTVVQRSGDSIALFEQDVHALLIHKDYERILQAAADQLPRQQKQVYILSKREGLKREEVALRLNLSPDTVKAHLTQAMRTIRAYCLARIELSVLILLSTGVLSVY